MVEPPRIIIKIPGLEFNESIVIKAPEKRLEEFVEFCHSEGAPDCYSAFEGMLLEEYIRRNKSLGKNGLKEMISLLIDKMEL